MALLLNHFSPRMPVSRRGRLALIFLMSSRVLKVKNVRVFISFKSNLSLEYLPTGGWTISINFKCNQNVEINLTNPPKTFQFFYPTYFLHLSAREIVWVVFSPPTVTSFSRNFTPFPPNKGVDGASFELVAAYTLRIRNKFRNCQRKTVRKSVIVMFAFVVCVSLYLGL